MYGTCRAYGKLQWRVQDFQEGVPISKPHGLRYDRVACLVAKLHLYIS